MKNLDLRGTHTKARFCASTAMSVLAIAALATPVAAQDADADEETVILDETEVADTTGGQIIVTGSRIRRSEATSSAPLQIIDPEIQRKAGANTTAEIVQQSPIANGSSQITAAVSSNTIAQGGLGVQTISLRGLGANRTLVLLNSRRAGPAGTRGQVTAFDLNTLPSSIVERVEILKDGASSIYGSDAVAGVVNLITKRATDGIEMDGFVNVPFHSGGEEYSVSAAWGKEFDRGHIMFAADYYKQKELERQDRDFLGCSPDLLWRTDSYEERIDLIDPRTGEYACTNDTAWGHVWAYFPSNVPRTISPSVLMQYSYDNQNLGQWLPEPGPVTGIFDIAAPDGWYPVAFYDPLAQALTNSYHPFEQKSSVIPETERFTLYADASYEITDNIEIYAEALFNRRENYIDSYNQFYNFGLSGVYWEDGDPEDPFPGWNDNIQLLSPTGILDNYDNEVTVDYFRAILGARIDIGDRFQLDVHGQHSRSDGDYALDQILQDSITQQSNRGFGSPCAGTVTEIAGKPCVQIAWTDPRVMAGYLTPEEEAYLTETEVGNTVYKQTFAEASINGEVFELPAGWVGLAAGAVYRRDEINDLPGHITYALAPGGDPNNPDDYIDNGFANPFSSGNTVGYRDTKEAFAEIEVPVFADKWFAQNFTLSASGRVTNVKSVRDVDGVSDSSNGNWTYKLQANWQVNDWLRVRSTFGTSYRAPALFELFLASQSSGARQSTIDPCVNWGQALEEQSITQQIADNCAADGIPDDKSGAGIQATVFTSGGLGRLEPETSEAFTASIILTPNIGPDTDIAFTVDYFDIRVDDEISQLSAAAIVRGCYESDAFPNEPLCDLFERGQEGDPTSIKTVQRQYINIANQINRGLDFTLNATHDFGSFGELNLLAQATLQLEDFLDRGFGTPSEEESDLNGDYGDPKFTADVNLVWQKDGWSVLYGVDIVGKTSSVADYADDFGSVCQETGNFVDNVYFGPYCVKPKTPMVIYHNASVTKEIADGRFEITAGVSNLFDKEPPLVSGLTFGVGTTNYLGTQYDWMGRRAFLRVGAKF